MREISLDDLPLYSPRVAPLFEDDARRTAVDHQWVYQRKYGQLLMAYEDGMTVEDVRALELRAVDGGTVLSRGSHLYEASIKEAMEASVAHLMSYLRPEAMLTGGVVDLGCGYGYLLHRLRKAVPDGVRLMGGEFHGSAVELAGYLGLDVFRYDFFDSIRDALWKEVEAPMVVTTSYVLHQLPSAWHAVEQLSRYREKIALVVSLEPEEDHFGDGLLGLLRRRYGQLNGYSADLGRVLRQRDDVEIELEDPAAVGMNALLPATVTIWRFR